ncbi:MAG: hypothetical protein JWM80_1809 [Cyanobacteria bacterium RYN_339]|nr:hypothetical protein [Cyanobacteria bacterium RYN_339]
MADDFKININPAPQPYVPPKPQPVVAPQGPPAALPPWLQPKDAKQVQDLKFAATPDLDDLDGPARPSFQQGLEGLPPEQLATKLYTDMLGRQPSAEELKGAVSAWNIMINEQKQSPAGARGEFLKTILNSPEFQVKQGREQLNMRYGVPVRIAGAGGQAVPFVWGSQTTGPGGAKFYHGQDLPTGPVDYKSGLNFLMEYMCNGTSGNPLMNMMRGFGKDDVSRTGLGSPAFEKLTQLGGELYHLGWGGSDHYGDGGSRRDPNSPAVEASKDPDLYVNLGSIRSPQEMAQYLDKRVQQLDKLAAQMDPELDSPAALQTVQHMREMLVAGRTFCQQIAGGASRATIVEQAPGAKAGWFAGGDPSRPLSGDLANWQKETCEQPLAAYQAALQDPTSYVARSAAYFLG